MEEKYVNASVAWTQQFCRINSFLGAGKREAVFLAEKILKESCDANVTVYDADTEEPYIIAAKTCENPKFQLLLEGHLDVVSPEGMEHPFDAEIKDGILYGRGSVDMKGGCGSMLAAFVNACQKPLVPDVFHRRGIRWGRNQKSFGKGLSAESGFCPDCGTDWWNHGNSTQRGSLD